MTSLNLLVSYGSDESSSEATETDLVSTLAQTKEEPQSENFFQADDDSSTGEEETINDNSHITKLTNSLKNPFRSSELPAGLSVFTNPYKEAEDAEKGTLEKHVKFAPKLEDVKEINGRKICWNYRKGRCRFGSNCVFAHDSELLQKKIEKTDSGQFVIASPRKDLSTENQVKSPSRVSPSKRPNSADKCKLGTPFSKKRK